MAQPLTIQTATVEQAAGISDLIRRVAAKQFETQFTKKGIKFFLNSTSVEAVTQHIKTDSRYWIACSGGRLVGVLGIRDSTHLFQLFVAESSQRQGVGTALLQQASQDIRLDSGGSFLTVYSSRLAISFYEKMGFASTGSEFWRNGVMAIPMKLDLNRQTLS